MALAFLKRKKANPRLCVVGLDGVPHSLLGTLCEKGVTPRMAEILKLGTCRRMKVTLPEISAVSWPSFMTGVNPGTHGIFGFTDLRPGSYALTFPCFRDLKAPTIWDRLGQSDKRSVVINQPSTYPARPIPGVLISGFVAIELKRAVHPPILEPMLRKMGYQIDIDTMRAREDHEFLMEDLDRALRGRERVFEFFWKDIDWDLFELVVTETDRVQHYLWSAVEDPSHPFHARVMDFYGKVDALVGRIFDAWREVSPFEGDGEGFYLLSDHGFTGIRQEVYLNRWLVENGFLSFEKEPADSLADLSSHARAFALDPNRIYVHAKGRYPRGAVEKSDIEKVKADLRAGLETLRHDGEKVFFRIFDRDEAYSGAETVNGPDLIAVGNHGYDIKGSVKEKALFKRTNLEGMHTWDDAFFFSHEATPENLVITDLAGMLLKKLGL